MFGTLFIKECKQILKSLVYYIYVIVLILFLTSQMSEVGVENLKKPEKGLDYYGPDISTDETDIMERTLADLLQETCNNSYATYPMAFYKGVVLNDTQLEEVKGIIEKFSGKDWDVLVQEMIEHYQKYEQTSYDEVMRATVEDRIKLKPEVTYEEFCGKMERVCALIGKGSAYEREKFEAGVDVACDYETALEEYTAICEKDRVTGAYMRLFCDFAGIILGFLPIFLGVTRCLRDKRSQVSHVVYARTANAGVIIGSRYLANVCMAFLPVVLVSFVHQLPWQYHAKTLGVSADIFAFLKYDVIWLLPEIMFVFAVSFLITEMTENVIAVFIQVFWALLSMFTAKSLLGAFGLKLLVRWNVLGAPVLFEQQKNQLYINRGFYFGLAVVVLIVTCLVYEKKRREGETIYGKIFKNRK